VQHCAIAGTLHSIPDRAVLCHCDFPTAPPPHQPGTLRHEHEGPGGVQHTCSHQPVWKQWCRKADAKGWASRLSRAVTQRQCSLRRRWIGRIKYSLQFPMFPKLQELLGKCWPQTESKVCRACVLCLLYYTAPPAGSAEGPEVSILPTTETTEGIVLHCKRSTWPSTHALSFTHTLPITHYTVAVTHTVPYTHTVAITHTVPYTCACTSSALAY
jgi:hypothetical protein